MLGVGLQRAVMLAGRTADRQTSGQLLLSHCRRAASTTTHNQGGVGFIFDIDGVLVRGKRPLPAARRAFHKLLDSQGHFLFPVVFVTNAGNCLRRQKAEQLSHILGVQISEDQVMLSHSPLQMFQRFHDKCVLVSGQGPVLDIANNLGFKKAVTIEQLREQYPLLDMVDHNRRPKLAASPLPHPKVEAVILLGEPVRWETNLQLVIDVLLTNGNLGSAYVPHDSAHLPVLACNMDLLWMAEAPSPRFGHGMFLACLENVYRKLTGRKLQYEALLGKPSQLTYQHAEYLLTQQAGHTPISTLYAIGDNLMTDIYGANLYNRYLGQRGVARTPSAKLVAQGSRDQVTTALPPQDETGTAAWDNLLSAATATSCQSILVCTGVYNPQSPLPSDQYSTVTETMFHGQCDDFLLDPALVEPRHIVDDVEAAVDLVFKQEGLDL